MSFYNMMHGYNPACLIIMPMLGRKQEDYPRFRDCFVVNKENIVILTRVGGNNRGCEGGLQHDHAPRFDDDFDSTYGYYLFKVPDKWKKDFDAIMEGRFSDVSDEYVEYLEQFWPDAAKKGVFKKIFREEGQPDEEHDHRPD